MNPLYLLSTMDMIERRWNRNQMRGIECLDCLMGAIGVNLSVDKTTYKVGEIPTYRISGGVPGGQIAWTSFKNGQSTNEFQADYGQRLSDSGAATLQAGQPWTVSDVGDWEKQVLIIPPDYAGDYNSLATAQVEFSVVSSSTASVTPAKPSIGSTGGILNQQVSLPLVGSVPVVAVAGVGLVVLFAVMGKGKR